jgi:hypothetical protein
MTERTSLYTYVFVRQDIPLAAQIVQVGHACLSGGSLFRPPPDDPPALVVLSVPSEGGLLRAVERLEWHGIRSAVFHEIDEPPGATAACTEPVSASQRWLFKKYPLWQA